MLTSVILPRDVVYIPDDAVDRAVEAVVVLRSQSERCVCACVHENGGRGPRPPFSGAKESRGAYRKMATLPPSNMRAWSEPGSTPSRDAIEKLLPFTLQHRGERRESPLSERVSKSRTRRCVQHRRSDRR